MPSFKPEVLHFKFNDFASLPVDSRSFKTQTQKDSNGKEWELVFGAGGCPISDKGWMALFLYAKDVHDAKCHFSLRDAFGNAVHEYEFGWNESTTFEEAFGCSRPSNSKTSVRGGGSCNFYQHSRIIDHREQYLVDGSLCIDVTVQVRAPDENFHHPSSPVSRNMLTLYESKMKTDIAFQIEDQILQVHSLILLANAPVLANLCETHDGNIDDPIVVPRTNPVVFDLLLRYIYAGELPQSRDMVRYGMELIESANMFEVVELKMAVETALVQERVISKTNAVKYLVFADAKNCALLKEYAIKFCSLHVRDILNSEHSKELRESAALMEEVMHANQAQQDLTTVSKKSVSELRKQVARLELEVDGSKQMLVARVEGYNSALGVSV